MSRAFLLALALVFGCGAAVSAADAAAAAPAVEAPAAAAAAVPAPKAAAPAAAVATDTAAVDALIAKFNPDLLNEKAGHLMESTFTAPASDIASEVKDYNWFTFIVFLPFLVLPQVLLLVTMLKFKDKGDGRKPATFMHHTKLENIWTAIPILTLFIVGIPAYPLLAKMELPPKNPDTVITVRGKSFAWDYEYKREGVAVGQDAGQLQEPMVLMKGKVVTLGITSNDVNHAWWVPAFGVKKDAIQGRYNNVWFTPNRAGFYKGQCAELCGTGHGIMVISAVVVETQAEFDGWVRLQRDRADTFKVFKALSPDSGQPDQAAVTAAIKDYLKKKDGADRVLSLRYWLASNLVSQSRAAPVYDRTQMTRADYDAAYARFKDFHDNVAPARRKLAESLIAGASLAQGAESVHPVVASQE